MTYTQISEPQGTFVVTDDYVSQKENVFVKPAKDAVQIIKTVAVESKKQLTRIVNIILSIIVVIVLIFISSLFYCFRNNIIRLVHSCIQKTISQKQEQITITHSSVSTLPTNTMFPTLTSLTQNENFQHILKPIVLRLELLISLVNTRKLIIETLLQPKCAINNLKLEDKLQSS
jgi:cell division protein FtsL